MPSMGVAPGVMHVAWSAAGEVEGEVMSVAAAWGRGPRCSTPA